MNSTETTLSIEQQAVVDAPLGPLSVIACAGSGKTRTAVHRIAAIRRQMGEHRGYVALLSFSNVAVRTFNGSYAEFLRQSKGVHGTNRLCIDTFDGFLTTNILRPHAHRTMGCKRTPFLITGTEPFLQNADLRFWPEQNSGRKFPVPTDELENIVIQIDDTGTSFYHRINSARRAINNAVTVVNRLGAIGAYTHSLGQYWAYRTLQHQPKILAALARRFPYIVVDEAQDIASAHQALLNLLMEAGSHVSLVGDPCQAIYEFTGADGKYLAHHAGRPGVRSHPLSTNYRSVPAIVAVASALSRRADVAHQPAAAGNHGAFFIGYDEGSVGRLLTSFRATIKDADLRADNSAVVCRSRKHANQLAGFDVEAGQGVMRSFASATVLRDRRNDHYAAYRQVAACIVALLVDPPEELLAQVCQPARYPDLRPLAREIWKFTCGLPSATLPASTVWQPQLVGQTKEFLATLDSGFGLKSATNLGQRLSKKDLPTGPLVSSSDEEAHLGARIRITTVHQVKGESLDAVLYLAQKDHLKAMINGVDTEVGRIGYVAITRARDLFWLGVPSKAIAQVRGPLRSLGFREASIDFNGDYGDSKSSASE